MVRILATMPDIFRATGMTLSLTVVSILFGMVLGLLLALGRISKNSFIRGLTWTYIWVFRGTPMLMQIFFLFFVLPKLLPMLTTSAFNTAVIALGLNSAAYLAEIIRAAIQSIDKGQMEAAGFNNIEIPEAMSEVVI